MRANSPRSSRPSARKGSSAGQWIRVAGILAGLTLTACATCPPAPETPRVLAADRRILPLPDGGYRVTETWLQERYQLERGLRLQLERCEAKRTAGREWRP